MRHGRRLLALALCAFLSVTPLCAGLTEAMEGGADAPVLWEAETTSEPEAAQDAPSGEEVQLEATPAIEAPAPEESQTPAPEASATAEPSEEVEATATPGDGGEGELPAIDYTRDASFSPDFSLGYAELLGEAVGYAGTAGEADAVCRLSGGAVYVRARTANAQPDRLEAAFERAGELCVLWIDARQLRPMSPEQCAEFIARRTAAGDALYLDEAGEIPLDRPACAPIGGEPETQAPEVTPTPAPGLRLPATEFVLGVGECCEISARFTDGADHAITYAPFDPKVASVSAGGEIKAKAKGETDILLTSEFGEELAVHVTVRKAPSKVTLTAPRKTLGVNEQLQLSAMLPKGESSRLTYSIAKKEAAIATVDESGLVTTFQPGSVSVKVSTFNGKTASVKLSVKPAPEDVALDCAQLTLGVGQGGQLTAALEPKGSAGAYSFRAEPEGVVRVDPASGKLEALAEGSATVTVETYNHRAASCAVTVLPAPEGIAFAEEAITIGVGESASVPVELPEGSAAGLSYASSDAKIATVGKKGVIRGVKAGKARITVSAHNGQSATLSVTVKAAPTKVTLGAPRQTLGVGERLQLKLTLPGNTASRARSYSSNHEDVLSVDESGTVAALAEGSATVTVQTFNGKKATLKFTVKPAPEGIAFDQDDMILGVGQKATLSATLSEGSAGAFAFSLEAGKEGVLQIDAATGEVEALSPGEAEVTVTAYNGVSDSRKIEVLPAPQGIELSFDSATIGVGESLQSPQVLLPEGSAASWSYKSSDTKVATVGKKGVIRGVKAGSAKITITTHNGAKAKLNLTVKAAPSKVTLGAHHKALGVGERLQLKLTLPANTASHERTYSSSREEILSVDESGTITALAEGSATITVQTFNGQKATLKFTVSPAPEAVTLPEALTLGKGEKYALATTLAPEGSGGGKTFSVDDPTVASIDPDSGALQALAPGETIVRVSTYNGCEAECRLTVKKAPKGISLQEKNFSLSKSDARQLLPPVLSGDDVASGALTYKSSDKAIAKVSSAGLVTAVKAGKANITVSTYNGKSASLTVTVKAAPKSISFAEKEHRLLIGDAFTPEVQFANGVAGSYALESSDPAIAAVEGASVRGVAGGEVTLTATSFNGKQAEMRVVVPFPPERVWLEPTALALGEGDSARLSARTPEGQGALMTFSIDDSGVATFESADNETILVRAVSMGETTVRVRTDNGCEAEAALRVLRAPTALRLSPVRAQYCLDEGSFQLEWTYGAEDEAGSVRFESSDEAVASVSAGGLVSLHKVGEAIITARSYNGHAATCELRVGERPGRMYFEREEYEVALGDSVRLDASFDAGCESYSLRSEDEATVAISGECVRGLALGSATVTATGSLSGLEASCLVRVVPAPEGVEFEQAEAELIIGYNSTLQLSARALPDGVGSVYYATTDPVVATVDASTGLVTAHDRGDCEIVATTYDGAHSARCAVHVSYLLEGVKVGIDPGHQAKGNLEQELCSPNGSRYKNKCAYSSAGVAHVQEHVIDLQIGLKLRDALEALGAEVYMTRETANVDISNQERAKMMNKLGVDFVLRIHANSWTSPDAQGLSIIRRASCAYPKKEVNGAKVMADEETLGAAIAHHFIKRTGCKWRGLGTSDDYTMNNWSKIPCLLVEVGFMTHPVEGMKIVKDAYQNKMVKGIVEGICAFEGRKLPKEWQF